MAPQTPNSHFYLDFLLFCMRVGALLGLGEALEMAAERSKLTLGFALLPPERSKWLMGPAPALVLPEHSKRLLGRCLVLERLKVYPYRKGKQK